jgi:hypothetical protein
MKTAKIDSNKLLDSLRGKLDDNSYDIVWQAMFDMVCGAKECTNAARYSSGYCSLCDLTLNEGKGVRND